MARKTKGFKVPVLLSAEETGLGTCAVFAFVDSG